MSKKVEKKDTKENILVCVAWPYVNYEIHLGHVVGCFLSADIFARFERQIGNRVLMVSGSDCHGTPIINAAEKEGLSYEEISEKYHKTQIELLKKLGITFDNYTKTTRENHKEIAQDIFSTLYEKGYLIEKTTDQLFDEKAGRFLPDRYVEGKCPHCGFEEARGDQCDNCGKTLEPTDLIDPISKLTKTKPILKRATQLYFDLPQFSKRLKDWIEKQKHWRPHVRNFALSWIEEGLQPTPVTRDLDWGVSVPIEKYKNKVMYVWFEAVMGYLTATIEWAKLNSKKLNYADILTQNIFVPSTDPELTAKKDKAWELFWKDKKARIYNFLGKDNIPFHTILWPAIILGYDKELNLPFDVSGNQFLNSKAGMKMSKSRGIFTTARELLEKFDVDTVRFCLAKILPEFHDSEFSWKGFYEINNAELVGKIGNFINRVFVLSKKYFGEKVPDGEIDKQVKAKIEKTLKEHKLLVGKVELSKALTEIIKFSQFANKYFDAEKPWESYEKDPKKTANTLYNCFQILSTLATLLYPFIPGKSSKLGHALGIEIENNPNFQLIEKGRAFKALPILFEKLDEKQLI